MSAELGSAGEATTSGLSQRQCYVEIASMFKHEVGQVVGRRRVVRLKGERFLVEVLGLLPIPPRIVECGETNIKLDIAWSQLDRTLIACNSLLDITFRNLEFGH